MQPVAWQLLLNRLADEGNGCCQEGVGAKCVMSPHVDLQTGATAALHGAKQVVAPQPLLTSSFVKQQ